ncbi:hypothetical protein JCM3770_003954 [Rhodotorula araucariae]
MATSGIVPVIDFRPFLVGTTAEKQHTADELVAAMRDVGFVMLRGFHDERAVTKPQVAEAFEQAKSFFDLDSATKDEVQWTCPEANRGYVRQGQERVTQATEKDEILHLRATAPDLKEHFEIGKDVRDSEGDSPFPNRWPASLPAFKPFMNEFFQSCHRLHLEIMSAVALGLGLSERYFDPMVSQQSHNLRLLNYPSVPRSAVSSSGNRAGSHSDYGSVTLLFQDSVGGLEVQDKDGKFVPATPVADTVVVNVGDLLQRWTNDTLKSTIHRVVLPDGDSEHTPRRQSIAFFSNPSLRQVITCLPELGPAKYPPVECEEYLVKRLGETFGTKFEKDIAAASAPVAVA